jgi:hypothetical protein
MFVTSHNADFMPVLTEPSPASRRWRSGGQAIGGHFPVEYAIDARALFQTPI